MVVKDFKCVSCGRVDEAMVPMADSSRPCGCGSVQHVAFLQPTPFRCGNTALRELRRGAEKDRRRIQVGG